MSDTLIFEDPPPSGRGKKRPEGTEIGRWLLTVKKHPGKWAKFPKEQLSASAPQTIKKGGFGFTKGEFESVSRSASNKRFWLYARYVGESK